MDKEIFVQNIKAYCDMRGVKPTVACRESGAGKDLINRIESGGNVPSVEKVQLLASYLGVTVSQLLGEEAEEAPTPSEEFTRLFSQLDPAEQQRELAYLRERVADQDT